MTEPKSIFFQLHERLQHAILHRLRWRSLRPVQEMTVKAVRDGLNTIVLAPTAGGKTEAAMFGVLDGLLRKRAGGLGALYLSPLRALLNNQELRLQNLTRMVGFDAFKWHGDVSASAKARFMKSPDTLLMTTPESLQVILMTQRYDQHALFASLKYVIVDEIHGFAGDDRGDHLLALLERLATFNNDFQRIGLSATVGNPEELVHWLQGSSTRDGTVVSPPSPRQKKIIQIIPLPEKMEAESTAALLARGKKTLLFADSRAKVEKMKAGLQAAGIRAFPHHGSLSRELRETSEEAFREGRNCSIICTSTMELGLDVGDLDMVLQLEAPNTVSAFLQRLGRTGRRPGSTARMTFLCTRTESFLIACGLLSLALKRWVEPVQLSRASYPIYVHQVLASVIAQAGASRKDLLRGNGAPYCFSDVSMEDRERILDEMLEQEVLSKVDSLYLIGPEGERRFGYSNFMNLYSVFETPPLMSVRTTANKEIGQLETWFVQSNEESACFLLGGQAWQIVRVDWRRGFIVVKPAPKGAVPTWMGQPVLLGKELCLAVRDLLRANDDPVYLGERGLRELARIRDEWAETVESPHLTFLPAGASTLLYTYAGGRVNNVIGRFHHFRTGQKVTVDNFFIRTAGSASELIESVDALAAGRLDSSTLESMLGGLNQSRLSKFQSCLPADLEAKFLLSRLFDEEGAREVCASFGGEEVRPVEQIAPQAPDVAYEPPVRIYESDDPFIRQLFDLAQRERTATKWVFVPNAKMKHTLAERLVRQGCDWVNFRFTTPFELALELAAPELLSEGVDPVPEGLGPPLVMQLLHSLPSRIPRYFRSLEQQSGVIDCLWSAVWELRMAGIRSTELACPNEKLEEFAALYKAYEDYLVSSGLGDRATVLLRALELESPVSQDDIFLEMPSVPWTPLEREWLDSLHGRRELSWCHTSPIPRRYGHLCPQREPVTLKHVADRSLLRLLRGDDAAREPSFDNTLQFFSAGRREAEIQEVLRRIVNNAIPLDEVEIVATARDQLPLFVDKFAQLEIPVTFNNGVTLLSTRTAQTLMGLIQWLESDFAAYHLHRLLLSERLAPPDMSAIKAARMLDRSGAKWGRDTYQHFLDGSKDKAQATLLEWINGLLASVPEVDSENRISVGELCRALEALLEHAKRFHDPLELSADGVLSKFLEEMRSFDALRLTVPEATSLLRKRLSEITCGASRARPGSIHVCSPTEVGLSGRKHTFILGLEEGVMGSTVPECPVLSDHERQSLHPALLLSADRQDEEQFLFLERLSSLEGEVTLSFSARDRATGEQLQPSWLFFAGLRLLYPNIRDFEQMLEVLGDPVGLVPDKDTTAATEAEWWLQSLKGQGHPVAETVRSGYPWLSRGVEASLQRASTKFTRYDGCVPSLAGILVPSEEEPISVSRLQDLASCAFRTFLRRGLALHPLEISPPDPSQWLDAATRGTLLHDIFADYYIALHGQDRKPDRNTDLLLLEELLEHRLDLLTRTNPCASDAVRAAEISRVRSDLENFLSLEAANDERRRPVGFEVGFGLPGSANETSPKVQDEFGTEQAVTLRLTDDLTLSFCGRIDRIDEVEGGIEVIDYKTGGRLSRARGLEYDGGRLIQHAVYALVAEKLLNSQVVHTSYYFPIKGAARAWLRFKRPGNRELATVLAYLLQPLEEGTFPQTSDNRTCGYCDYRTACTSRKDNLVRATLQDESNQELEWRRRLDEIQ